MKPIVVDSEIDLPDVRKLVKVSLEAKGVGFTVFAIDLFLGEKRIKRVVENATHRDVGKRYELEDAVVLRGLGFDCGGVVGSTVDDTIDLHCLFAVDGQTFKSKTATIKLSGNTMSREFHLRCTFE